jgi:hypothetical protein
MHRPPTRRARLAVVGALLATLAAVRQPGQLRHTGGAQTWTVPAGVTEATFDVYGAQGGSGYVAFDAAGKGGRATATIAVTPGETFQINVGGRGGAGPGGAGGFNGGGVAGTSYANWTAAAAAAAPTSAAAACRCKTA